MLKQKSVKKEKEKREREIDLEMRPPFYTCPPRETTAKGLLLRFQKPQLSCGWETKEGGKMNEGAAERENRESTTLLCGLTHYLKDPFSWFNHLSCFPPLPLWNRRPKQKDALYLPRYDTYSATLTPAASTITLLQDPPPLAKMRRHAMNR